MIKPQTIKIFLTVSLIFGIFILASFPNLGKISYWPPDTDKIAMDGVFLLDCVKDLPRSLLHPYQYAVEYYVRYPSLSVGQRPLFFPAVEALLYAMMGLTYTAPRIGILLFLYVGMLSWVLLVTKTHNIKVAVLSLLLWLSNPNIYIYSQNILLEIPTLSMSLLTLYLLYRYFSTPSVRMGILLGITTGLMLWTNQKAAFMLPMFLLYPLCSKKPKLLMTRNTWILATVILLFLIPLTFLSIWLGDHNIALSIKDHMAPRQAQMVKNGHSQLFVYLLFLYQDHFSLPILSLAVLGIAIAIFKKDGNSVLYGLTIFCVYLTFTIISVKIPRYAIYWVPPFCFFAALGILEIAQALSRRIKQRKMLITYSLCSIPIIFQIGISFPIHIYHVSGYEAAARYVLKHSRSPVLFFNGTGNGQFSFFVRKLDPEKRFMILRGQKIISTSLIHNDHHMTVYLHNMKEIHDELQRMGVQYAVVESPLETPEIPAYKALMNLLQNPKFFTLKKTIPLKIVPPHWNKDYKLLIYENRSPSPINRNQPLTLRLPVAGKTLRVTLGEVVKFSSILPSPQISKQSPALKTDK